MARYKVLGIPLITVTGFLTAAFLGFNLWHWFTNDLYAATWTPCTSWGACTCWRS